MSRNMVEAGRMSKSWVKKLFRYAQHGYLNELQECLTDVSDGSHKPSRDDYRLDEYGMRSNEETLKHAVNSIRDPAGDTLLIRACRGVAFRVVEWLLDVAKSDPNIPNNVIYKTALHEAASCSNPIASEIVRMLLLHGAQVAPTKYNDWTPMSYACHNNCAKSASILLAYMTPLQRELCLSEKNKEGSTNLYLSCRSKSVEIVRVLLELGADANSTNNNKRRPAHACAMNGDVEMCLRLVDYGADLSACRDSSGSTLWHEAALHGHADFIEYFLVKRLGPDMLKSLKNCLDNSKRHPLHLASRYGHANCVSAILRVCNNEGQIINAQDIDGATPMHLAVIHNHLDVLEILLQQKQTICDIKTKKGLTPENIARTWGHHNCIEAIQAAIQKMGQFELSEI